jgi:hypothetical protein
VNDYLDFNNHNLRPHPVRWAWQFFRAAGKIDRLNAVAKGIVGLENSHRIGLPGFIATPRLFFIKAMVLPFRPQSATIFSNAVFILRKNNESSSCCCSCRRHGSRWR